MGECPGGSTLERPCIVILFISPDTYRQIISGARRDPLAAVVRGLLTLAEPPYGCVVRWRNRQFDRHPDKSVRVPAHVISVGNLTLGGTGKTPLVAWIARWWQQRQVPVSIVSRGYGAPENGQNDEALELARRLPDVPHLQNRQRCVAALQAVHELGSEVILLDDGFQHRSLARDLDIVLVDATDPFGGDRLFPRGLLREPIAGLARADVIVVTRCDQVPAERLREIRRRIGQVAPRAALANVIFRPDQLTDASGERQPLSALEGQVVLSFCGIGNPAGFRKTLQTAGLLVQDSQTFPDHHRFTPSDIRRLATWCDASTAAAVICTGKDMVKLPHRQLGRLPLWALQIEPHFQSGQAALEARLRRLNPPSAPVAEGDATV